MNRDELELLISRHLDGRASEAEVAALSRELETGEPSRELYLRLARLHAALAAEETSAAGAAASFIPPGVSRDDRGWMGWLRLRPLAAAASFAGLALLLAAGWMAAGWWTNGAGVVAHFEDLKECRWVGRGTAVQTGSVIRRGQMVELASGTAGIRFGSGARATLVGPCIFEVTSANGGFLTLGQMKAVAGTPQSKGFTVRTRTARVVDMGTEFVTSAAADGQSRVDVTSGEVFVHLAGVKTPQRLRTGEACSVEAGPAQVVVRIESGDGTAAFRFPSIDPPSDRDYADHARGQASIRVVEGALHATAPIPSGPADLLLDGRGQSEPDSPAESVFFDNNISGALLMDLGRPITVTRINTYSWHVTHNGKNRVRAVQKFTLYGFAGDVPPAVGGPLTEAGWVPLARVNSDDFFRIMQPIDRPAQQACSITGAHGLVGRYRFLLWEVEPSQSPEPLFFNNTFYGEFDVYGEP